MSRWRSRKPVRRRSPVLGCCLATDTAESAPVLWRVARDRTLHLRGDAGEHGVGEAAQIFRPLSEWGDGEFDDFEAIEEILSEPPLVHVLREVAIRGRDDSRIELPLAIFADASDLVLLERAKELHLQGQRHLADLVEEQCALVGCLEQTGTVLDRAGERAARVTEQLALEERLWQRTAVDRDERSAGPR